MKLKIIEGRRDANEKSEQTINTTMRIRADDRLFRIEWLSLLVRAVRTLPRIQCHGKLICVWDRSLFEPLKNI